MEAIDKTIEKLAEGGWPPVFVFLYDELWDMVQKLWTLMEEWLGEDCVLEPSFFAWAVTAQRVGAKVGGPEGLKQPGPAASIGGNFGLPHRSGA
jgi:hypothetical protein